MRDHLRLQEKVLRVADLVTADSTKQGGMSAEDFGETYLCIRTAFSAAFDELLLQASQGTILQRCLFLMLWPASAKDSAAIQKACGSMHDIGWLCSPDNTGKMALDVQIAPAEQAEAVEELWTFLADYFDRTVARANIAITDAARHRDSKEDVCSLAFVGLTLPHSGLYLLAVRYPPVLVPTVNLEA